MVIVICHLLFVSSVQAVSDPRATTNNKFGIHLISPTESDIADAAALVNGNGGKYGYVTLVIREDERDVARWQAVFDSMRRKKLIPIVRIATKGENGSWRVPSKEDATEWAHFLNKLRWVSRNRYVILFNEPNHGQEWGGVANAASYAEVAHAFAQALKKENTDFFVMLAGLDLAAPNAGTQTQSAESFYSQLFNAVPPENWKGMLDGLSSHSYPNPGFAGYPTDNGRQSVRGYDWELGQLSAYGFSNLPVFITETGWKMGERADLNEEKVAQHMVDSYKNVWLADNRVVAVTPFALTYQQEPFLGFSWRRVGDGYYPVYNAVREMKKDPGAPILLEKLETTTPLPSQMTADSVVSFVVRFRNTGESIINPSEYTIAGKNLPEGMTMNITALPVLEPGNEGEVLITMRSPKKEGVYEPHIALFKNGTPVAESAWRLEAVPKVSLQVFMKLLFAGLKPKADFEVQFFDRNNNLVYRQANLQENNGVIELPDIKNVIIGDEYRIVVLRPYYLPRQGYVVLQKEGNKIALKPMLPLDFNNDGKLSMGDVVPWAK